MIVTVRPPPGEARPAGITGPGRVRAEEPFERFAVELGGQTRTVIGHRDDDLRRVAVPSDVGGRVTVTRDVLEDHVQHGLQGDRVGHRADRFPAHTQHVAVRPFAAMHGRSRHRGYIDGFERELHAALLGARQIQQPVGEAGQIVHLAQDVLTQDGVVLGQHLDPLSDERQRGAELVRRIRREARLRLVGPLDRAHGSARQPPSGAQADHDGDPAAGEQQQPDPVDQLILGEHRSTRRHPRDRLAPHLRRQDHHANTFTRHGQVGDRLGVRREPRRGLRRLADETSPRRREDGGLNARLRRDVGVGWRDRRTRFLDPLNDARGDGGALGRHGRVEAAGQQEQSDAAERHQDHQEHHRMGDRDAPPEGAEH